MKVLLFLLLLTSCTTTNKPTITVRNTNPVIILHPKVDQLKLRTINWNIITLDNYIEVFEKLQKQGSPAILYGITVKDYEELSLNINDIRSLVQQQQVVIDSLREQINSYGKQ